MAQSHPKEDKTMEKKVTLELTEEQASALEIYLLMTTNYRNSQKRRS